MLELLRLLRTARLPVEPHVATAHPCLPTAAGKGSGDGATRRVQEPSLATAPAGPYSWHLTQQTAQAAQMPVSFCAHRHNTAVSQDWLLPPSLGDRLA